MLNRVNGSSVSPLSKNWPLLLIATKISRSCVAIQNRPNTLVFELRVRGLVYLAKCHSWEKSARIVELIVSTAAINSDYLKELKYNNTITLSICSVIFFALTWPSKVSAITSSDPSSLHLVTTDFVFLSCSLTKAKQTIVFDTKTRALSVNHELN